MEGKTIKTTFGAIINLGPPKKVTPPEMCLIAEWICNSARGDSLLFIIKKICVQSCNLAPGHEQSL